MEIVHAPFCSRGGGSDTPVDCNLGDWLDLLHDLLILIKKA